MKRKILYFLILIVLTGVGLAFHLYIFGAANKKSGNILIYASPDSTVFVNNIAEGRTPISIELAPGKYKIKLIPNALNPAKEEKAIPWEGTVEVYSKYTTFVRRDLENTENESAGETVIMMKSNAELKRDKGEVRVRSIPEGAIISLDGADVGVSPDAFIDVAPGVHDISVYATRYKRRSVQVNVLSGLATLVDFELGVDPDYEKKYPFGVLFEASSSATLPNVPKTTREPTPTASPENVEVLDTPTGFLRVRQEPSLSGKEVAQVKPGEIYPFISSENGWTKIKLTDGNVGWVSSEYVKESK